LHGATPTPHTGYIGADVVIAGNRLDTVKKVASRRACSVQASKIEKHLHRQFKAAGS
jgi:hypothetical protein